MTTTRTPRAKDGPIKRRVRKRAARFVSGVAGEVAMDRIRAQRLSPISDPSTVGRIVPVDEDEEHYWTLPSFEPSGSTRPPWSCAGPRPQPAGAGPRSAAHLGHHLLGVAEVGEPRRRKRHSRGNSYRIPGAVASRMKASVAGPRSVAGATGEGAALSSPSVRRAGRCRRPTRCPRRPGSRSPASRSPGRWGP